MPAKRTTRAPAQAAAPTSVWADRLAGMQDSAKASMANYDPNGFRVLEGIFVARETCRFDLTQNGDTKIVRTFYILEGENANSSITDGLTIENNEIGLHNARRWVELHGIEWPEDNLPELENIINQINEMAATVEIRSKASKPTDDGRIFANVFVNRLLDGTETPPAEGDVPPAEDGSDVQTTEEPYDANQDPQDSQADADQAQADADEAQRQELLILCSSHNITDVDDSMDRDTICQILSGFKWTNDDNLTAEENALLEDIGLANTIERRPPPPARKPAAAPAPAPRPTARQAAPAARASAPVSRPAARPAAAPAARPAAARSAARPAARPAAPAARARVASGKK